MKTPNTFNIAAQAREVGAKTAASLRAEGKVPAVLYGPKVEANAHILVEELRLEKILSERDIQFVEVQIEGGQNYQTLLRKVEFHPTSDRPIHADFYVVDEEHTITLNVPLELTGTSAGVIEGGRLFKPLRAIKIKSLPHHIPARVEADISAMKIGDSLHVKELDLGDATPLVDGRRTVATIKPPRGGMKALQQAEE